MARRAPLSVWLYGQRVGTLTGPTFGKLRFDIDPTVFDRWAPGSTVLSIALPLEPDRRPNATNVLAFFDGLLPEDTDRTRLESRFGVPRGDTFGLLGEIGRDCAGAVVITPDDEAPDDEAPDERPGRVGPLDLRAAIGQLATRPLGAGPDVRVSLAGLQEKLLAVRNDDGTFGQPLDGYPSNVILKPEPATTPGYATNEVLCSRLALAAGLTTVEVELIDVAGQPVVVVPRYDRGAFQTGPRQGTEYRIHQEDSCQALAVVCQDQHRKYEKHGGPTLAAVARLLDLHGDTGDRGALLAYAAFNVAIGNTDAHGKNISILHHRKGHAELAPIYDVSATSIAIPKHTDELAMRIDGVRSIHDVTRTNLENEAVAWGVRRTTAGAIVDDLLSKVRTAARSDDAGALDSALASHVAQRADDLLSGRTPRPSRSGAARRVDRPNRRD